MADDPVDIELKFDGLPVRRLDGAPADAVISSLTALQRMVYIIGMRSEGRSLSERLKPSAKVKREYALICRAPKQGSHIQPFNVASQNGAFTPAAVAARKVLIETLKAFDSGDEAVVERVLPNARERWFMAKAALGLLPQEDSELEVMVRVGSRGPFSFKGERARVILEKYEGGSPPEVDHEVVAGKLRAIDFAQTILTVKPTYDPSFRLDYPLPLESWLTANVRRRLKFSGRPKINEKGNLSSFRELKKVTELEPTLEPIDTFLAGAQTVFTSRPLAIPATVYWQDRIFVFKDKTIGVDAFAPRYEDLRQAILEDLEILWLHYATAPDRELDKAALSVKSALLARFKVAA